MKFLTTGEFAKLCGTQKSTLFFYDKEGLLKPKYVSGNGYRRYGVEQFYDFDMIGMLKEAGSSIKEIRACLLEKNQEKILAFFEEKQRLLQQEMATLLRRQKMLDGIVKAFREALASPHDVLEIVVMGEEALELVPVTPEEQASAESCVDVFSEFARRFESQGRHAIGPFGGMIRKDNVGTGEHVVEYFFCGADKNTPKSNLHIKPRGRYAVLFHSGNMDSHTAAYMNMIEAVKKSGLTIIGNVYAYDMASYFTTGNMEEYMTKFCLHVE